MKSKKGYEGQMTCASGDIRAEEGKIAGTDWKSGQYQGVRSDLATRIRVGLTYTSKH